MGIAAGSMAVLPAWAIGWTIENISAAGGFLSPVNQQMLASVVDTILPASKDGFGGLAVGVDKFLDKLFARCYETEVQDNIRVQLEGLHEASSKVYNTNFEAGNQEQRLALLGALEKSENVAEKDFFELIKSETIRGFSTSQKVMTRYLKYRVVPGNYQGCVPVEIK
jgi:hypothetical protein